MQKAEKLRVTTAFSLNTSLKKKIRETLWLCLPAEPEVDFYQESRLLAGILVVFILLMQFLVVLDKVPFGAVTPLHVLIALLCCWSVFVVVLHDICRRRCLIR